jgi:hypothetical protein
MLRMGMQEETFVECVENSDSESRLLFWRNRLKELMAKTIPPWRECQEAISHIEELEGSISD